jgi:membrane fusion protein (multidrug efflux system)
MRKILGILIALGVVVGLALPKLKSRADAEDAADAPPPQARTLRVSVERAAPRELVERLATTGTVRANEQVDLVSEISGKIERILFAEGSRVAAGQVLLEIDDEALQAERERVSFRVALAERQEERQHELLDEGVISQDGYDLALNQLNVLRSELRVIEAQLLKTKIRAPFSGVIGLRYASPGSYLSPATRIASLQDLSAVKLDFSVPEKYSARMRKGGEVTFSVKGSEQEFRGEIYAIEPSVDPATRSLLLRARCPNPRGILVPGAFADVRLVVQRVEDALTVPSMAVIPELGGKKVFVLEDGTAQPRQVTTGIRTDERVEVVSGLEPGEQVIVSAIQQLRPGLEVEAES